MNDEPNKRGPGRPRKNNPDPEPTTPSRGRGRPRKTEEEKQRTLELAKERKRLKEELGVSTLGNELSPGDNARFLDHAMTIMKQPPIDITNPREVEARIEWYFGHCVNGDMKPTVSGMCNAIGIHRDTLHTWKTGEARRGTHQEVVLRAYRVLEELWEDYMLNGKVNPVAGIFLGKNLFQYRDQQEYVLTPNQGNIPEAIDAATIEAKYAELPDCED